MAGDKPIDIEKALESPAVKRLNAALEPKGEEANPKKLKSLKELIFLGRTSQNIEISGFTFEISTLSSKESRETFIYLFSKYGDNWALHNQTATLAQAIRSVNGAPLETIYEGEEGDPFKQRLSVVEDLATSLTGRLFSEYLKLVNESKDVLTDSKSELKK
jgi:hypothetical protein